MIGDAGLRHLAGSRSLVKLESLDLDSNDIGTIGTTGIEVFVASSCLQQLRSLRLSQNPLGNLGVRELLAWPGLAELRKLDLSHCRMTTPGARRLAAVSNLHPDIRLNLKGNTIDEGTRSLLRDRFDDRVSLD
jgi:hypothetical protein